MKTRFPLGIVLLLLTPLQVVADDSPSEKLDRLLRDLPSKDLIRSDLGVTRKETPIPCLFTADDLDAKSKRTRILLIGGLDGSASSVEAVMGCMRWYWTADEAKGARERFALSVVPCANPDAWAVGKGPGNLSEGNPTTGYPPKGDAYNSPTDPEAAYLWRWIGLHAPDVVLIVTGGDKETWSIPDAKHEKLEALSALLKPTRHSERGSLTSGLLLAPPANVGLVPAVGLATPERVAEKFFPTFLSALEKVKLTGPSPARLEIQLRLARSPLELGKQLSKRYGHDLTSVQYIPAMALVGRLRLGELTKDTSHKADVERIVAPYVEGKKSALGDRPGGVTIAGHLVFAELAEMTKDVKYRDLVRKAGDRGLGEGGKPLDVIPGHNEMSDAVFMHCPLLARAGKLTGEKRYFEACANNLAFMRKLCARDDGLYRNSPLDRAAWGRGNGFPALGLALSLTDIPADDATREPILKAYREHMAALLKHQDATGAWHQVIDVPGSYRELTATCMIAFAMARGVRLGWLDAEKYDPAIRRAWDAIRTRVAVDGTLVDVCEGTGKQKDLRAYLDRRAILGADPRGGAMALLAAVEIAEWEKTK